MNRELSPESAAPLKFIDLTVSSLFTCLISNFSVLVHSHSTQQHRENNLRLVGEHNGAFNSLRARYLAHELLER